MPEPRFRKGDFVRFRLGIRFVQGQIREDRGPIGVQGRHLYLVEFPADHPSSARSLVELPADQLQPEGDSVTME